MQTMERRTLPGDPAVEIHWDDENILVAGYPEGPDYVLVITGDLHIPFPIEIKRWLGEGCRGSGKMVYDDCIVYRLYDNCPRSTKAHLCRAERKQERKELRASARAILVNL